ncbi:MAG: plasmid mobilization relaxosome protein MobC [Nitrospirae bacterium]|nr:plasmid mobilization relaxosome protein MobC [Nitrospirota bacterium]
MTKAKQSGSEKRQRYLYVKARVTPEERDQVDKAAEREGLSIGSFIRSRALAAPTTRAIRRPPIQAALLSKLLGQLGKIGGNLNQIAFRLNTGATVLHSEIDIALLNLHEIGDQFLELLGKSRRA